MQRGGWLVKDISSKSDIEKTRERCEFAFQNLKKARVVIAGIILDGFPFMAEFEFPQHQYTHEQKRMKQDLAIIHQKLCQIHALDGF